MQFSRNGDAKPDGYYTRDSDQSRYSDNFTSDRYPNYGRGKLHAPAVWAVHYARRLSRADGYLWLH
jgi:hypothetical protein